MSNNFPGFYDVNNIMEETRQCTACKKALFNDEFKVNKGGKVTKTCKKCLEKAKTYREKSKCSQKEKVTMQRLQAPRCLSIVREGLHAKTAEEAPFASIIHKGLHAKTAEVPRFVSIIDKKSNAKTAEVPQASMVR